MQSRWRWLGLACAHVLSGCEPRAAAGEPCELGTSQIVYTRDRWGDPQDVLLCGLEVGCDGPPRASWYGHSSSWFGRATGYTFCDCVGETHTISVGSPRSVRWRWVGSCEEPCADVEYDPEAGELRYRTDSWEGTELVEWPFAPHCATCEDARAGPDLTYGECSDSLGRSLPGDCCRFCAEAVLGVDGVCRHPEGGTMPGCCEDCTEAVFDEWGACATPEGGWTSFSCCSCSDAIVDAEGRCVDGERCDCASAELAADGSCVDSTSGLPIADFCCAS